MASDPAAEMADLTLEAMKNLPTAERERRIRSAGDDVMSWLIEQCSGVPGVEGSLATCPCRAACAVRYIRSILADNGELRERLRRDDADL